MTVHWRKAITEIWGTFILTLVVCTSKGDPFAVGSTLFCIIVGTGVISGAHYNPAVTIAIILVEMGNKVKDNLATHLVYFPMQIMGAVAAALVSWEMYDETIELKISDDSTLSQAVFVEILGTYILAYVIVTCGEHNAIRLSPGIAVGSALFVIIKTVGSVSGGGFNPAIAFAVDLADALNNGWDRFDDHPIYWIGPVVGAILASGFYFIMIPGFRVKLEEKKLDMSPNVTRRVQAQEDEDVGYDQYMVERDLKVTEFKQNI